jgi:hypothetical protein
MKNKINPKTGSIYRLALAISYLLLAICLPQALPAQTTNFITNGSFEDGFTGWEPGSSGNVAIVNTDVSSGNCLQTATILSSPRIWSYRYQVLSGIQPNTDYFVMGKVKVQSQGYARINLYDSQWKDASGKITGKSFARAVYPGNQWTELSFLAHVPEKDDYGQSVKDHEWRLYLYAFDDAGSVSGSAYFDDISLVVSPGINPIVYGCNNENGVSSCLDFGSLSETADIVSSASLTAQETSNDGTTFRKLKPRSTLTVKIPEFNVDSFGFPLTPMILEVRYKDTIDSEGVNYKTNWTTTYRRACVESIINYTSDDVLLANNDKQLYKIFGLGETASGQWKIQQNAFNDQYFPLIRAIDGYFSFKITMPNIFIEDGDLYLPIDYISLKAVTSQEYEGFSSWQRQIRGFFEVNTPLDSPSGAASYLDSGLVLFNRDIMRPIYKDTKPSLEEVNNLPIKGYTAPGQIEAVSLGMYSQSGISALAVEVSDLINESQQIIPSANIQVNSVAYHQSSLLPYSYSKAYALVPDYLEGFTSLSIAPQTSKRIWFKITVPEESRGGLYSGNITVKQNGQILANIPLQLDVLPIKLDKPGQINIIYHDPYTKAYSSNQEEVFKVFRETEADVFMHSSFGIKPKLTNGVITDFSIDLFEQKLDKFISEGIIKDTIFIETSSLWGAVYGSIYGAYPSSEELNIYSKLNNSLFRNAFILAVQKIYQAGQKRGIPFILSIVDEPGVDPYKRICSDRLYTFLKEAGFKTTVTYYTECEDAISSGKYFVPGIDGQLAQNAVIPSLSALIDYKIWAPSQIGQGYLKGYENYGYYTTYLAHIRNPAVNRYLHGIFAFRTQAKVVSSYAFGDILKDPYDDFDPSGYYIFPFVYPDFILAYPTWSGKMLPTLAVEGMRMGIQDAKYIATLKRLSIQCDNYSLVEQINNYLSAIQGKGSTDLWGDYLRNNPSPFGLYKEILRVVSSNNDPDDWEAFSQKKMQMHAYIKELLNNNLYGDVSLDGEISAYDSALVAQASVGLITLSAQQASRADVSGGGGVTAYDAALIAQRSVDLIDQFPVEYEAGY